MTEPVNQPVSGKRRGTSPRVVLVILLAVFLAPAVGGWLWYEFGSGFTRKNLGTLYDPARPLGDIAFAGASGDADSLADLGGGWLLAWVGEGPCGDDCLAWLDKLNRVRLSLGEKSRRVRVLYLSSSVADTATAERIAAVIPGGVAAVLDAAAFEALVGDLAHDGEGRAQVLHRAYLIDPIGNLVLSYEADAEPGDIRKDLSRLLFVSQIG